jgi:hypothetical protein
MKKSVRRMCSFLRRGWLDQEGGGVDGPWRAAAGKPTSSPKDPSSVEPSSESPVARFLLDGVLLGASTE